MAAEPPAGGAAAQAWAQATWLKRPDLIHTVVFKRGKDGLQGKSLAESCKSFDTCFLFQRDMAKNGFTSISRVRAGACMSPNEP